MFARQLWRLHPCYVAEESIPAYKSPTTISIGLPTFLMSCEQAYPLKSFEESKKSSPVIGDFEEKLDSGSFNTAEGDEALQLVGMEAKEHFSDEFNRRLRRKLVRKFGILRTLVCGSVVNNVWIVGPDHPDNLCSSLLYSIPVRPPCNVSTPYVLTWLSSDKTSLNYARQGIIQIQSNSYQVFTVLWAFPSWAR